MWLFMVLTSCSIYQLTHCGLYCTFTARWQLTANLIFDILKNIYFGLAGVLVGLAARHACTIIGETLLYVKLLDFKKFKSCGLHKGVTYVSCVLLGRDQWLPAVSSGCLETSRSGCVIWHCVMIEKRLFSCHIWSRNFIHSGSTALPHGDE